MFWQETKKNFKKDSTIWKQNTQLRTGMNTLTRKTSQVLKPNDSTGYHTQKKDGIPKLPCTSTHFVFNQHISHFCVHACQSEKRCPYTTARRSCTQGKANEQTKANQQQTGLSISWSLSNKVNSSYRRKRPPERRHERALKDDQRSQGYMEMERK